MTNPLVTLVAFRFYEADNSNPDSCTAIDTQGTDITRDAGAGAYFMVRFRIDETNGKNWGATVQLEYDNTTQATGWTNVTGSSSHIQANNGGTPADGASLATAQLTGGTGTYAAGLYDEVDGLTGTISVAKGDITEVAFCVFIEGTAAASDSIDLRATVTGVTTTWTAVATVTVGANVTVEIPVGAIAVTGYIPTITTSANITTEIPVGSLAMGGAAAVTPDTWNEQFETNPGYDETYSEGETVTGGATFDEDYATSSVTGDPGDWDSLCAQLVYVAVQDCYNEDRAIGDLAVTYSRFEFILAAESLADTEVNYIALFRDNLGADLYTLAIRDNAGTPTLDVDIYHDGSANTYSAALSLDTRYSVEVYWNSTADEWEWKLDQVSQNSGSLTGAAATQTLDRIRVGAKASGVEASATFYLDNIGIDITEWIGSAAGAGLPPTVEVTTVWTPPVGAIAATGYIPTITAIADDNVSVEVPVGSVAVTGYAPTVELEPTTEIPVGSAALTGYAPDIDLQAQPEIPVGSAAVTGYVPTIDLQAQPEVPVGSAALTGYLPTVELQPSTEIPVGSVAVTGYAPVPGIGVNITPPVGSIAATGYEPTAELEPSTTVPVGALAATGYVPTVSAGGDQSVEVPVGALSIAGYIPTVTAIADVSTEIPVGALAATGYVPTVTAEAGVTTTVPVGSVTATGLAPSIELAWEQTVPVGTVTLAGYAPVVSTGNAQVVTPPVGSLGLTGYAPTLVMPVSVTVPAAAIGLFGYAPTLVMPVSQLVPTGVLALTGYEPDAYTGVAPALQTPLTIVFTLGKHRAHMTSGEHAARVGATRHSAHFDAG